SAAATLTRTALDLKIAFAELRELARGLHPPLLTDEGLGAALSALADRSALPVHLGVCEGRFSSQVESAAYFVASQALANATRHADASYVSISVTRSDDVLVVEVADDGVGGADPSHGSGLRGLDDRVAAVGGTLTVSSAPRTGTTVRAEI